MRTNSPSDANPVQSSSKRGNSQAAAPYKIKPTSPSPRTRRPHDTRQHNTNPSINSHCTAPVREAVAALDIASNASPQATSKPVNHPGQAFPPCTGAAVPGWSRRACI